MPRISIVLSAHYDPEADSTHLHAHVQTKLETGETTDRIEHYRHDAEILWDHHHQTSVTIALNKAVQRFQDAIDTYWAAI